MGGSVSAGIDNDDLIDNLIEADYIKTPSVEKVFRTVDRAFYYLPEFRFSAYRDMAWKHGNLHLSAPCIYCEVLENINLEPGRSFLNIGSGTGYLSTMAGLILGPYGTNHGIEIQSDVVDYAYERLEQFKKTSNALDVFEFCEPYFAVGNGFDLSPERKYDRIYCGAACPREHHELIKKYLKVNGILIVPCEEDLLKIVRTSETAWEAISVLSVSFSTLQSPEKLLKTICIPEPQPLLLKELCRSKIRCVLRELVENEDPSLKEKPKRPPRNPEFNSRARNRVILSSVRGGGRLDLSNVILHNYSSVLFRDIIHNSRRDREATGDPEVSDADNQVVLVDDSDSSSSESEHEHDFSSNSNTSPNQHNDGCRYEVGVIPRFAQDESEVGLIEFLSSEDDDGDGGDDPDSEIDLEEISADILDDESSFKLPTLDGYSSDGADVDPDEHQVRSSNKVNQNVRRQAEEEDDDQPKKLLKREKLDSGISEESDDGKVSRSYESSFSESSFSEPMEVESDDSETNLSGEDYEKYLDDPTDERKHMLEIKSFPYKYRLQIEKKIQCLPLPQRLKIYLNHDREFCVSMN